MKKIMNIEKYYVILGFVMVGLSVVVIYVFRSGFGAISQSKAVDQEYLELNTPRLNHDSIERARKLIYEKEVTGLDL